MVQSFSYLEATGTLETGLRGDQKTAQTSGRGGDPEPSFVAASSVDESQRETPSISRLLMSSIFLSSGGNKASF